MELLLSLFTVSLMTASVRPQDDIQGPCFEFLGNAYLYFTPTNFNNDDEIHYTLQFRTNRDNGVILYARGDGGDDEALYMRNGKLRYHLFNTSPTGVEGYFGAYREGNELVNTNQWIKVHFYRSWKHIERTQRRVRRKTGFEVEIQGNISRYIDFLERTDISIRPTIYIGGYKASLSATVLNFTGQIKDIYEEKNHYLFEDPTFNYRSQVSTDCSDLDRSNP